MSGPERRFTTSLHKLLPPDLHHEGMANPYRGGTPDHWYSGRRDLWIEFKWVDLPARPDTIIDLTAGKNPSMSKLQQNWIVNRRAEGRNVWVIVGCTGGGVVFRNGDESFLAPCPTDEFKSLILPKVDIAELILAFTQGS